MHARRGGITTGRVNVRKSEDDIGGALRMDEHLPHLLLSHCSLRATLRVCFAVAREVFK